MPRMKRSGAFWAVAMFLSTYGESDASGQGAETAPLLVVEAYASWLEDAEAD